MVRTVKDMLKKNSDPYLALLGYRDTHLEFRASLQLSYLWGGDCKLVFQFCLNDFLPRLTKS